MKTLDFIKQNIGNKVYITGGDLSINPVMSRIVNNKIELTLIGLSRGGRALVSDDRGRVYSVRPSNVREVGN